MLLSYLEVRAYDKRTVGLVIGARTRSASNLVERRAATLLVIEPDLTVYVKLRAVDGPLPVADAGEQQEPKILGAHRVVFPFTMRSGARRTPR